MRSIINRKVYDTERAEAVAEWSYGSRGDWHYVSETLYRTSRGSWFIHGRGGPMTTYARAIDTTTTAGGSRIRPLSETEALDWLEQHDRADVIEDRFPAMVEEA